jgi:localization factor PodJL
MVLRGDSKFSVTSLCAEAGVERIQFRIYFSGKTALMAALMARPASAADPVAQLQPEAAAPIVSQPISEPVVEAPASESQALQPVSKAEKTSEPGVSTPDAWLERRLRVFERALNALEAKADTAAREQARAIAQLQEQLDRTVLSPPAAEAAPLAASVFKPTSALQRFETTVVAFAPAPKPVREPRVELAAQESEPAAPEMAPENAQEIQAPAAIRPELELPALPPATDAAASKEEMADVLQIAREKARAAVEIQDTPQPPRKQTRWWTVGAVALAALSLCVGLSLGRNFLANNANAHPQSDGVTQRHQASVPLAKTTALADAGNPRAQARLALAYLRGQGSAGDANAALLWAMSAAKAGDPVAQYLLGALYQQGDHVKADPDQAFVWFSRAAEKGNLKAMHNLAIAYAHGYGTPKDDAQAVEWFTRAAERGYVDSAFDLAVFYERGIGVRQDLKQSLKWYGVAAMAGDAPSKDRAVSLRREMKPADVKLADAAAMAFAPLPALTDANNP